MYNFTKKNKLTESTVGLDKLVEELGCVIFWTDHRNNTVLSSLVCSMKTILFHYFTSKKFLFYRYPSYYPSYGPTAGSTSFYTTDLTPFSTNRSNTDFPKSVRSDPGIAKDIKQEQDVKEHGSFFLPTDSNWCFQKMLEIEE